MRLNYFDYFRAIAIIFVVAGHSYSTWAIDSMPELLLANLIKGGSTLFVFISGFFFHHIYYKNFHYRRFLIKKSKNLFLPYAVLSSIGFFFLIVIDLDKHNLMIVWDLNTIYDMGILFAQYLWTGSAFKEYWYIPFIMIIFVISPIFIRYIKLSKKKQIYIFIVMLLISTLIHRSVNNLYPIHSVIYFFPIYLFGIIFSINDTIILDYIKNKSLLLGGTVILISLVQIIFYGTYDNFHKKVFFSYNGVDILIIQKVFMILFFLSVLNKINHKEIFILKYIASISFAIYLLHPCLLFVISHFALIDYIDFLPGIVVFGIKTSLLIIISIVIANLLKLFFNKKSSYIIGW